ncbi:type II secretion system F family protein [Nocardioidaceae bacterium]|nr:type II secretion system F family protein [Nocardioidaceae bacterium]
MSLTGAFLGLVAGAGMLLVAATVLTARRPSLADRVLPYVRDVVPDYRPPSISWTARWRAVVHRLGVQLDRTMGGSHSVRRRLDQLGSEMTLLDFRVSQAVWGLVGLAVAGQVTLLVALRAPSRTPSLLVLCGVAFVLGVLLRENALSSQVKRREREVLLELPVLAELMALAVAAGEGPVTALARVVERSDGAFSDDLGWVLREVRTGTPLALALETMAARSGLPPVSRFAQTLAVSVERGTPLADVLHSQAHDVREAARRQLIESAARREVLMMVPVVFLVLPVTVVFAFWPGFIGLELTP